MRGFRAILMLLAVVIGQAHACASLYVRADGAPCEACFSIPRESDSCKATGLAAKSGDCHDCCTLKSCDDRPSHAVKATQASLSWELDCPVFELPTISFVEVPRPRISILTADQFANPPPTERPSRAPPFRLS